MPLETITKQLILNIASPLTINTATLPVANVGLSYAHLLVAIGGRPPYTWSLTSGAPPSGVTLAATGSLFGIPSALPPGLSMNASSGAIAGTPTAAGAFSFTAQIKDSAEATASAFLSLTVVSPPSIDTPSPLAAAVAGTAYLQSLSASGGTPPYQWSLRAGALPAGLTLDPASGAIRGKPTAPGRVTFTVQIQDSAGLSASKPFDLTVTQRLSVAPATLVFRPPFASQTIQASCSTVGAPLSISTSVPWLAASTTSSASPAAISVSADPRGLGPGTYQGSISISTGGLLSAVSVTLTVEPAARTGSQASPSTLNFAFALGAEAAAKSVSVTGASFTPTVAPGAPWLSASASGDSALAVTANPVGMSPGTYSGRILLDDGSAGSSVAVNMSISGASQNLVLSQTGLTFYTVAGSTGSQSRSLGVLNTGQGSMDWTVTTSTLSGPRASWLTATPATGVSGAALPASTLSVNVNPSGLEAGEYYGQVAVAAPSAGNSPQLVSVVLNVLPADKSPGAQIYPSGLLFIGVAHGPNPDAKTVSLTNVAPAAAGYTSSITTDDGGNWITVTPASGSVPASSSSNLTIQPNIASLGSGVWQGVITLRFGDASVRNVSVALVLRAASAAGSPKAHLASACNPSKLVPLFTSIGSSFSVPASWPSALEMEIVDDCGDPLTSGSVVTTFSNGDPALALTSLREGNWGGAWTPRAVSSAGVTLRVKRATQAATFRARLTSLEACTRIRIHP